MLPLCWCSSLAPPLLMRRATPAAKPAMSPPYEHAADQAAAGSATLASTDARSRPANVRTAPERQRWARRATESVSHACQLRCGMEREGDNPLANPWLAGPAPTARLPKAELEERILNLLSSQNMCVLATAGAGGPLATPVRFYHLDFTVVIGSPARSPPWLARQHQVAWRCPESPPPPSTALCLARPAWKQSSGRVSGSPTDVAAVLAHDADSRPMSGCLAARLGRAAARRPAVADRLADPASPSGTRSTATRQDRRWSPCTAASSPSTAASATSSPGSPRAAG